MKTFNPMFHRDYLESHGFKVKSEQLADSNIFLITPDLRKSGWTTQDLIFRSSIWDDQGLPVSLSFKKFFNWGENFQLVPPPTTVANLNVIEKLDGSTIIISKYKGELLVRTRGSFSYDHHENFKEVENFIAKNPQVTRFEDTPTWVNSYIFEWYSPTHKIVIDYGPLPIFWLTGVISHEDYSYMTQEALDIKAEWHSLKRPRRYTVNSIEDIIKLKPITDEMAEGFCVYFNGDQDILKVKSPKYLAVHAFKSELSIDKVVDLFMVYNKPGYHEFMQLVYNHFDYECCVYARPMISKICDAAKEVEAVITHMIKFVDNLKGETRKWAAAEIISSYGNTNKSGMAFTLLDDKPITPKQYKTLLEQMLR